jgi:hypothetical protein
VLDVAANRVAGVDRLLVGDAHRLVVAELLRFAARHQRQRQSEWERKNVHRRSFQLWP